ncbi:MAG: hypothetical protein M1822_005106 [Bathelium mastoideum]|nr:MAG: hypothetical protein M1822_005106 [Bathelium mastoideum]
MASLSTFQKLQAILFISNTLVQSSSVLNSTNDSYPKAFSRSPTTTLTSISSNGIGAYIAQGLNFDGSSSISIASPEFSLASQSRTNSILSSNQYSENTQGSDIFSSTTYTSDSPGPPLNGTLSTTAEPASVIGALIVSANGTSSDRNVTAPPRFTSTSTYSKQITSSSQNSSDLDSFCMTAAARYPAQRNVIDCYCSESSWQRSYTSYSSIYLTQTGIEPSGQTVYVTTSTTIAANTSTITPTNVTPYTLCDGWPRVNGSLVTEITTFTITYTLSDPPQAVGHPFPSPPTCTVDQAGCAWLYYNSSLPDTQTDIALLALCGDPAHLGQPCLVAGDSIKLLYFPELSNPDDICNATNSTNPLSDSDNLGLTNEAKQSLVTVQTLGTTFTSGTAYLSIGTLYAHSDGFGNRVGPTFSNYILPLASTQVHTICGRSDSNNISQWELGTPLDFRHLNYPVPYAAYSCAGVCEDLQYATLYPSQCTLYNYNPYLALPTILTQLAPEWVWCNLWDQNVNNVWYDPPTALVPQLAAATPTDTFISTTTKPAPSPTTKPAAPVTETRPTLSPPPPSPSASHSGFSAASPNTDPTTHDPVSTQLSNLPQPIVSVIASSHLASASPDNSASTISVSSGASLASADPDSSNSDPIARLSNLGSMISSIFTGSSAPGKRPAPSSGTFVAPNPAVPIISAITNDGGGNGVMNSDAPSPTGGNEGGSVDPAPNPKPIGTAGSQPISVHNSDLGGVTFDSQTPTRDPWATKKGHAAPAAPSGVAIDGSSTVPSAIPAASEAVDPNSQSSGTGAGSQPYTVLSLGSSAITIAPVPGPSGVFTVAGSSLTVGGSPAVIGGHTVSAVASGVIVNGPNGASTTAFVSAAGAGASAGAVGSGAVLTLGSQGSIATAVPVAGSNSIYQIGGTQVTVGGAPAVISGQTVSVAPSGIYINGPNGASIVPFSATTDTGANAGAVESGAVLTLGPEGSLVTATPILGSNSVYEIGGTQVTVGGAPAVVDGQAISADSSGFVVEGSNDATYTLPFSSISADPGISGEEAIFTADGHTYTAQGTNVGGKEVIIMSGSALSPVMTLTLSGAAITTNGMTLSAASSGILVDGSLVLLPSAAATAAEAEATLTLGGDAVTVSGVSGHTNGVAVDGVTLTEDGSAAVVDGQTVSLGTSGVVVDGKSGKATVALNTGSKGTATGTGTGTGASTGSGGAVSSGTGPAIAATTAGAEKIKGGRESVWFVGLASLLVGGLAMLW